MNTGEFQEDMDSAELLSVSDQNGAVIVTLLAREVTMFTLAEVRMTLDKVVAQKPGLLILDVSQTRYLDSSGMAVLFKLRHQVNSYQGRFCIAGLTGQLKNVMSKILKKDSIPIYDDVATALRAR